MTNEEFYEKMISPLNSNYPPPINAEPEPGESKQKSEPIFCENCEFCRSNDEITVFGKPVPGFQCLHPSNMNKNRTWLREHKLSPMNSPAVLNSYNDCKNYQPKRLHEICSIEQALEFFYSEV